MRTRGRVLGAEWNGWDNCTALKTPTKYPPPKSYTTPSPVAPSHSNYEPRAGRSEYNFLYCVNVRTYVWIRKMFILQKKKKIQSAYLYSLHLTTLLDTNRIYTKKYVQLCFPKFEQTYKNLILLWDLLRIARTLTCCLLATFRRWSLSRIVVHINAVVFRILKYQSRQWHLTYSN